MLILHLEKLKSRALCFCGVAGAPVVQKSFMCVLQIYLWDKLQLCLWVVRTLVSSVAYQHIVYLWLSSFEFCLAFKATLQDALGNQLWTKEHTYCLLMCFLIVFLRFFALLVFLSWCLLCLFVCKQFQTEYVAYTYCGINVFINTHIMSHNHPVCILVSCCYQLFQPSHFWVLKYVDMNDTLNKYFINVCV